MKTIVIGGGPSGMMAAITAKKQGDEVILLEKKESLGRKLLITGKGRCNITSSLSMDEFIKNTPTNGRFLYSSFEQFTNLDIIEFLKKHGLKVKEERGNRIFPITDKSIDVLKCFEKEIQDLKIKIEYNTKVKEIFADKVILATGGKSYPLTGATGDGYDMAKKLGHKIVKIRPSLVPLETYNDDICKSLQGLSLKNVKIKV